MTWARHFSLDRATRIAAMLIAACVGLLLVAWIDTGSRAIEDLSVKRLLVQPLARPDITDVRPVKYTPKDIPFRLGGRFAAARIAFETPDPAAGDLALFIRRGRDNYAVYVNGRLAAPTPGILSEHPTLHGFHPRLIKLLPALLVQGTNHIDIVVARNATIATVREVYFGPAARLEPAFTHSQILLFDVPLLTATMAAIVLLFALALASLIRAPALMVTIALTLGFFLLRELHTLWVDQAWPQSLRDQYLFLAVTGLWISAAAFANEWYRGRPQWRKVFAGMGAAAWTSIIALYALLPCQDAAVAAGWIENGITLLVLPLMAQRMFVFYANASASAAGEMIAGGVAFVMAAFSFITLLGLDYRASLVAPLHGEAFAGFASIGLICLIAIGLARHGVGVYRLAALNNETLAQRVAEKERELEANHALLRDRERDHALLAERGRIMRDVHDGIGSQLLGLLIQARGGHAAGESLIAGIQSALDDLYLVVDSLDQVDGPLETALGTFRARIEPKCAAAGIAIDWRVESIGDTNTVGPTSVLQIYRILQEALSNAIRHGKPNRLTFGLRRHPRDQCQVEISLQDDGSGFDPKKNATIGRGLANMRKRAASIGGMLDVTSDAGGSCVRIVLPV